MVNLDGVSVTGNQKKALIGYFQTLSTERLKQKERYRRVKDCYYGRYSPHRKHFFTSIVKDFDSKNNLIFDDPYFTRDVVQNLALVYREQPVRKFYKGDQLLEDQEYIDSIYDNFIMTDKMLNKMVKALSTCDYYMYYDEEDSCIKDRILTPDIYDIIQDKYNPQKKKALIYEIESDDSANVKQQRLVKFVYWDQNYHGVFKVAYKTTDKAQVTEFYPVEFESIIETENDYNKIPSIRVVDTETVSDYFQDDNANIFDNAEEILYVKASSKAQTFVYQGFGVPVLTTGVPNKYDSFTLSPAEVAIMQKGSVGEADDRIEFVSSSDLLTPTEDAYEKAYINKLKVFGITESSGSVAVNKSGVSIALSNDQKNKIINADKDIYSKFEKDRFELIKAINNYHFLKGAKGFQRIGEDITMSVSYKDIEMTKSVDESIKIEQHNLDYKLWGFRELYKYRHPDIDEAELERMVAEAEEREKLSLDLLDIPEEVNED